MKKKSCQAFIGNHHPSLLRMIGLKTLKKTGEIIKTSILHTNSKLELHLCLTYNVKQNRRKKSVIWKLETRA